MKRLAYRILNSKGVQHIFFWLLSLLFISINFSISNEIKSIDLIYSLFFHLCLLPVVYVTTQLLIPRLLQRGKYILLSISFILNIGLGYMIHQVVFELLIPNLPIDYFIVSFVGPWRLIFILASYSVLASLFYLSKSWFYIESIKAESNSMELHNLRLQINPHFLLNSLNSIYGLTLENDKKAPDAILQLSDLLKHMLYQKDQKVDLDEEIKHLKNYIELQKLRTKHPERIIINIEQNTFQGKIIPFLLLTFVENAFKHSDFQTNKSGYINLMIDNEEKLIFSLKNTYRNNNNKNQKSGVGLNNALRRLELLYPDNHEIDIKAKNDVFDITLTLSV